MKLTFKITKLPKLPNSIQKGPGANKYAPVPKIFKTFIVIVVV